MMSGNSESTSSAADDLHLSVTSDRSQNGTSDLFGLDRPRKPSSTDDLQTVEVPEKEDFSFEKFLRENPNLRWPAIHDDGDGDREEERVAPTMSPSTIPARHSTEQTSSDSNDSSSSTDSLTRLLLKPPPSRRALNLPPSTSLPHTSTEEKVYTFQEFMRTFTTSVGRNTISEGATPSPRRVSKRRRSDLGLTSQSSSASENVSTSSRLSGTGSEGLDMQSAIFLARHRSPPKLRKPVVCQRSTKDIDPYAVGLATVNEVLRDGTMLMKDLERDAREIGWKRRKKPCVCDVHRHPSWWTVSHVQDVHNYSFLLDCEDLEFNVDTIVATNKTKTVVIYNIPMDHHNPFKQKAEQVLRFVDVEVGVGDQTCNNLFHYNQPFDRKVLMVVYRGRVVGIVVAEEVQSAHRILSETARFRELEEEPVRVRVGINRLWVHVSMRRQHLATTLCQLVGIRFYEDEALRVEDYAFNNISDSMVIFAKVFLNTVRPPLYCRLR